MWNPEFYEDDKGHNPVEKWMSSLSDEKFAALDAAIELLLCPNGLSLAGTPWLTPLGDKVYEFRVRHSKEQIENLYSNTTPFPPAKQPEKILLRLFVMFHGDKVILLLHGYDKARNDKPRFQQRQIKLAKKRAADWQRQQQAARKADSR